MSLVVVYKDVKNKRWIAGADSSVSSTSTICQKLSKGSAKLRELKDKKNKIIGLFGMTGNISKMDLFYEEISRILNTAGELKTKELNTKIKSSIVSLIKQEGDDQEDGFEIILIYYDRFYLVSSNDGGLFEIQDNLYASGVSIDYALGYLQCVIDNDFLGDTITTHMLKMYQHLAEDGNFIKPPFIFYFYQYEPHVEKRNRTNKRI